MSSMFPNGTQFSVSTALAASAAISAITNGKPAEATATTAPAEDAVILLASPWDGLNERVSRVGTVASGEFELLGIDTTNIQKYPAGLGPGSYRAVSDWVLLSQITTQEKTGGEQQFYTWRYLNDTSNRQRQRKTYKNAKALTLTLDYDPALAWYEALMAADENYETAVLRAVLPNNKGTLYYPVDVAFDGDPTMTLDVNMQNTATFSMVGEFTRVADI